MAQELRAITGRGADDLLRELRDKSITKDNLVGIVPGNGSRIIAFYWADSHEPIPVVKKRGRPPKPDTLKRESGSEDDELDEIT